MHFSETATFKDAATKVTETNAPPLTGADKAAYAFYATAATAALVGQVWAGVTHIPWPEEGFSPFLKIALVTPAVAVIELGGVATAALADLRRRKGEQAYAYRAMSLFAAVVALVFNVVGHWRPEERFLAFGFGGLSAFAYVLWLIHSSARRRDALRRAGQMASTGPVYGVVQWAREPRVTWLARGLALEHGYGLYESLRVARVQMRNNARRDAIAGTVAEYIRSEHQDERLAKIAETTYDADRLAGMLEERINYEVVTNKLTLAISPPAPNADHIQAGPADSQAGGVGEKARGSADQKLPPKVELPPAHEHMSGDTDISNWWIAMVQKAGVTSFDLPDAGGRSALPDTPWSASNTPRARQAVATKPGLAEERSYSQGAGTPGAPAAPIRLHEPAPEQERSNEHLHVKRSSQPQEEVIPQVSTGITPPPPLPEAPSERSPLLYERTSNEGALHQERPPKERSAPTETHQHQALGAPQLATVQHSERAPQLPTNRVTSGAGDRAVTPREVDRSERVEHDKPPTMPDGRSADSRNTATKSPAGTKWDEAKRLLDDWPADTDRTGTALAKLIGGSSSYARKLIVRYDEERRSAHALELVRERSS